ncbi:MAG: hypothetical protein B2I17_08920 [Thermoplasmatales archaeon B_DKE]|nr:MAG: hypothetical protein B2I17_08920 [Thermoplasmatales archaeon B_DKE]
MGKHLNLVLKAYYSVRFIIIVIILILMPTDKKQLTLLVDSNHIFRAKSFGLNVSKFLEGRLTEFFNTKNEKNNGKSQNTAYCEVGS